MEHPHLEVGIIAPTNERPMDYYDSRIGYPELGLCANIEIDPKEQRKRQLQACRATLTGFAKGEDTEGTKSLKFILRHVRRGEWPDSLGTHLGRIASDIDDVAKAVYGHIAGDQREPHFFNVELSVEQQPNPDSRVLLSDEKDAFGLNQIKLDWRLTDDDYRGLVETTNLLATAVGAKNIGRMRIDLDKDRKNGWPERLRWGWDHIGTTRMSDNPKTGVVDRDCRVHGVANLYVAGSSVFPTSGAGVPTLTIVALAARLAQHLRRDPV